MHVYLLLAPHGSVTEEDPFLIAEHISLAAQGSIVCGCKCRSLFASHGASTRAGGLHSTPPEPGSLRRAPADCGRPAIVGTFARIAGKQRQT